MHQLQVSIVLDCAFPLGLLSSKDLPGYVGFFVEISALPDLSDRVIQVVRDPDNRFQMYSLEATGQA